MTMPQPPPSSSFSSSPSFCSMDDLTRPFDRMIIREDINHLNHNTTNNNDLELPMSARECLIELIQQVDHDNLRQVLKVELKRLLTDHERLVTMLQQRTQQLEQENNQLKNISDEHQKRYEKAVREMQFFKKKFDYLSKQQQPTTSSPQPTATAATQIVHSNSSTTTATSRSRSLSVESDTLSELPTFSASTSYHNNNNNYQQQYPAPPAPTHLHHNSLPPQHAPPPPPPQQQALPPTPASPPQQRLQQPSLAGGYPLTPTSPQPSVISDATYESQHSNGRGGAMPSRSSSSSTASSLLHHYHQQQHQQTPPSQSYWNGTSLPSSVSSISSASASMATMSLADNPSRQPPQHPIRHPGTNSIYSVSSDHTTGTDMSSIHQGMMLQQGGQGQGQRSFLRHNPSLHSSYSSPSTASSNLSGNGSAGPGTVYSVPMTPVRSATSTSGYTGSSMIQQRRVDPLMFGGSDGLWDTIAKSKGSDVTVEKIISNFLRRGGSPNTAKQSPGTSAVKYGYGMIHALIVTKAPGALDLLLQQGANPNAMTMSEQEDDKVTPCYLAASVGWLAGLQKLVQAGGDLIQARGQGPRNKTALHTAAEHCHAAVVEFIVGYTQGALNLEVDNIGATALHYASLSGHTDLVCFLIRSCRIPANQNDHRGEQPIHWASRAGRLEVVTLLVERFGCDINAYVSKRVPTPLELAKSNSHKRLLDYLKGMGALTTKKMDKKRNEEKSKNPPSHLESTLATNGLLGGDDDAFF